MALVKFKSGVIGQYTSQWYAPGRWRVTIYADNVCFLIQPLESARAIYRGGREEPIPLSDEDQRYKPGFYEQAKYFLDCVAKGHMVKYPGCDMEDYLQTVRLIDAITGEQSVVA
jgi:predicted dehydrogenase